MVPIPTIPPINQDIQARAERREYSSIARMNAFNTLAAALQNPSLDSAVLADWPNPMRNGETPEDLFEGVAEMLTGLMVKHGNHPPKFRAARKAAARIEAYVEAYERLPGGLNSHPVEAKVAEHDDLLRDLVKRVKNLEISEAS